MTEHSWQGGNVIVPRAGNGFKRCPLLSRKGDLYCCHESD